MEVSSCGATTRDDYSKESLAQLHDRINRILAQLPSITGRANVLVCKSNISRSVSPGTPELAVCGNDSEKVDTFIHANMSLGTLKKEKTTTKMKNRSRISPRMESLTDPTETKIRKERAMRSPRNLDQLKRLNFRVPRLPSPRILDTPSDEWASTKTVRHLKDINLSSDHEFSTDQSSFLAGSARSFFSCNDRKTVYLTESTRTNELNTSFDSNKEDAAEELISTQLDKLQLQTNQLTDETKIDEAAEVIEAEADKNEEIEEENYEIFESKMWKQIKKCNSPSQLFSQFVSSSDLAEALYTFKQLCTVCKLDPGWHRTRTLRVLFPHLAQTSRSFQGVNKMLAEKLKMSVYDKQGVCANKNVIVIGAGPCGLRAAIECALLGARVVVAEKRADFSRTNCIYLWSYVIEDLLSLGANFVGGKFSAGRSSSSTENVYSISLTQLVLLKIALLLGVTIATSVEFRDIKYPAEGFANGFTCLFTRDRHKSIFSTDDKFDFRTFPVHALICASGQNVSLPKGMFTERQTKKKSIQPGFGITANFQKPRISKSTLDLSTPETARSSKSSDGYVHNVKCAMEKGFFHQTVMHYDLDKLYFIMTANPHILKSCGAIKEYFHDDKIKSTAPENVDCDALAQYATAAANFATHGQFYPLKMDLNKYKTPDVSLFYCSPNVTANHAGKILESNGRKLFVFLVGDSLIHPFWKTGSGLAKGFMSVYDAAWVFKIYSSLPDQPLLSLALQESLYMFLKNLQSSAVKTFDGTFSIDPSTRYKTLTALPVVNTKDVRSLIEDDDKRQTTLPRLDLKRQNSVATNSSDFSVLNIFKKLKNNMV